MSERPWGLVDDLLNQADHLATWDAGRPKQSSLRRAISTAYYAVFHELAFLCANELISWNKEWKFVTPIYRSLDHGAPKRFLNAPQVSAVDPNVAKSIRLFVKLQEERHRADYDPEFSSNRSEAIQLILQARKAVELIRSIPSGDKKLLAVHLITSSRRRN